MANAWGLESYVYISSGTAILNITILVEKLFDGYFLRVEHQCSHVVVVGLC